MDDARIDALLADLTLEERCRLLAGASTWRTHAIDRLGIPAVKMSDGPNGVRGELTAGSSTRSVLVPVGIAQGATWDPALIERVGDLLGREARRKSAHVLLAPAVNLHRTPVGGRTFEYFSEDPELTAALAAATVRGVQANDVAVTVKHFVANDTEVDRMTVDVQVPERVLRELYLRPFEAAVRDAGAWGVMSAYNRLDGEFCSANRHLLVDILRDEWGFDGFVVSDWFGAHETVPTGQGGLTVEMPGPAKVLGHHLLAAVEAGEVDEAEVADRAREVLVLAERTQAATRPADAPEETVDDPEERALCREVAVAGTVLLRNQHDALPLVVDGPGAVHRVAVVGPNAAVTRTMGGGSSSLTSLPQRSLLDALVDRVPAVVHEPGRPIDRHTPLPPADALVGPDGEPGLEMRIVNGRDPDGEAVHTSRTHTAHVRFFGSLPPGVDANRAMLTVRGAYLPRIDGPHRIGAVVTGRAAVTIGGVQVIDPEERLPTGEAFFGFGSEEQVATVEARTQEPISIDVAVPLRNAFGGLRLGIAPPVDPHAIDRAVEAAAAADAAVVVVGTTDEWETEGHDRTTIALPGDQDQLVSWVAAVNPRTIVVVNAGAPVAMPWIDEVAAVVVPFFGGMEMADAVVDVLLGERDPGGRLPTTFPVRLEDAPAWPHYAPDDGTQTYGEGFSIGYRGHDRSGVAPLFPFGHGLSYGATTWGTATVDRTEIPVDGEVRLTVPVTATEDRDATVVVQGYVAPIDPPVEREPKALRAWAKLVVPAGTTTEVELGFGPDAFRRWDDVAHAWTVDPGAYDLVVAASAADVRSTVRVTVG